MTYDGSAFTPRPKSLDQRPGCSLATTILVSAIIVLGAVACCGGWILAVIWK